MTLDLFRKRDSSRCKFPDIFEFDVISGNVAAMSSLDGDLAATIPSLLEPERLQTILFQEQ
jgi:hypothetical protein